jgi:hypothetical protein
LPLLLLLLLLLLLCMCSISLFLLPLLLHFITPQELAQAKQERKAQLAETREERAAARALETRARKMAAAAAAAEAAQCFGKQRVCLTSCKLSVWILLRLIADFSAVGLRSCPPLCTCLGVTVICNRHMTLLFALQTASRRGKVVTAHYSCQTPA